MIAAIAMSMVKSASEPTARARAGWEAANSCKAEIGASSASDGSVARKLSSRAPGHDRAVAEPRARADNSRKAQRGAQPRVIANVLGMRQIPL